MARRPSRKAPEKAVDHAEAVGHAFMLRGAGSLAMYVVTVEFEIEASRRDEFLPLMLANARSSLEQEGGCRQFDVCTSPERPATVFLYEVYDDRVEFERHLASPHFIAFDRSTAPLVRRKRVSTWTRVPPGASAGADGPSRSGDEARRPDPA